MGAVLDLRQHLWRGSTAHAVAARRGCQRQPLQTSTFDLSDLALKVVDNLRHAEADRQIEVSVAPGLRVNADPGLVRILLENLIGNAWKFTLQTAQPRVEVGSEQHEGVTCYFVRDNGAGFDMAGAGKLFTPFQRMHRLDEFEGSGIGLSIVQRIVARHQGRTWAESKPGEGATLRFTLS